MRRIALAAVVLTGVGAVATPAAAARARFKPLGRALGPVYTDGVRYAAYQLDGDTTRVLDTRKRTSFDVSTPADCVASPGVGGVTAVGGGQVAWKCRSGDQIPQLLDIASRTIRRAALPTVPYVYYVSDIYAVGSSWTLLRQINAAGKGSDVYAVNWRTGEALREPGGARQALDLNSSGLLRRMCEPLKRASRRSFGPLYADFDYEPPYGLSSDPRGLRLYRCGGKSTRLRGRAYDFRLAGGVATWTSGDYGSRRFNAYAPASGRRLSLRFSSPPAASGSQVPIYQRTLNRVFASTYSPGTPASTSRFGLFVAAWNPRGR